MSKKWFVFYTKSRQEKKANDLLRKNGFEPFLPLQLVMRQWSDRKKKVEVPLFNSYIFVLVEEHAIQDVVRIPGIAWNIKLNGKPAILHPKEMETIVRFIETGLLIETHAQPEEFSPGDKVKVLDGPLRGAEGILTQFRNKHLFSVVLGSIGQVITVQIDREIIQKLDLGTKNADT